MKAIMFPGQGAQYKGMGKALFKKYSREILRASEVVGYDLENLCLEDPNKKLGLTEFTQPALYVVNSLGYLDQLKNGQPDYLIGHSLGEYNALLAAGAFDFETGLRLVQKRGQLMAMASGGSMAAVMGINVETLETKLHEKNYLNISIANYNTPTQTVIAGKKEAIDFIVKDFTDQGIRIIPLFVSAPFHSPYMKSAAQEFEIFLRDFNFSPLKIPVIANATGMIYDNNLIADLLSTQIASPVQWSNIVRSLLAVGVSMFEEVGGVILTKMVNEIKQDFSITQNKGYSEIKKVEKNIEKPDAEKIISANENDENFLLHSQELSQRLGSKQFRKDYGIKYSYLAGAMYRGIASKDLVVRLGKAGMLGFLGTGGMSIKEIEEDIRFIQQQLTNGESYGMNLLHNMTNPGIEMETVQLYLRYNIKNIEAAAFMQITPPLVLFRLKGVKKNQGRGIICNHKIIAKVSRPEVAEAFMRPAPEKIVKKLLDNGLISIEEADLGKQVPMSCDICVEADSGGHTTRGSAIVLLPSIQQLAKNIQHEFGYSIPIRTGLAGGLGTPQAVACAYIMGADFVLTGSINQCTVEAGISDVVKDLLQDIDVQDTDYAPAGDMFEIGAKVQVLKKGVLFPARANKLFALYNQYDSLTQIPEKTIEQLEKNYFKKPIEEVWIETKSYFKNNGYESEIEKAEKSAKHKMALVFRWYFNYSARLAFEGNLHDKVNFQVHVGPSLGAFNQWVKGTELENWRNRHVDIIAIKIMNEAASLLKSSLVNYSN